jgi:hypothetical protein
VESIAHERPLCRSYLSFEELLRLGATPEEV